MTSSALYTFIVNPKAGRGRASEIIPWLRDKLDVHGLGYELMLTSMKGHAVELARQAHGDTVVAVGGDGTINEVLNGMDLSQKILGIIPGGSGNDLIKSLQIPDNLPDAFQVLITRNSRQVDFGEMSYRSYGGNTDHSSSRKFINGVGIGFDAAVAEETTHIKYARGFGMYLLAVLKTLGKYRAPMFNIELGTTSISSRCLLIAIGNGRCVGGGFFLTPEAVIDDGKFEVCIIEDKSVYGIMKVMPKVMKGRHGPSDGAQSYRVEAIHVRSDDGFHAHADGEILGDDLLNDIQISIGPGSITMITP